MLRALKQTSVPSDEPAASGVLETADGSRATIALREGKERIAVENAEGALIFEYEPATGRAVVHVPRGDLSVRAAGDIDFVAGGSIRAVSAREVALDAASGVSLRSRGAGDELAAGVSLRDGEVRLAGKRLEVGADEARFRLGDGTVQADRLAVAATQARMVFETVETLAGRVIARAKNVYQRVEELHDLKAGRLRAVVTSALDLKADTATLRADRDVHIDGEKINLG